MNNNDKEVVTLNGEVDSVIRKIPETGFAVILLSADSELISVVGELGDIEVGEELSCTGRFQEHRKFGRQFRVENMVRTLPTSTDSIKRYLASGIVKGVNAVLAKRIVEAFGEDTFDIIENEHTRLTEVEGIGRESARKIHEEFAQTSAARSLVNKLAKFDLPVSVSIRAFKLWETKAEKAVTDNPYLLCKEEIGVAFAKADSIAQELKLPHENPDRINAGISCVLRENANAGHTALPLDALKANTCKFLQTEGELFDKCLGYLLEEEDVFSYEQYGRTFIMLRDYYRAEDYIARRLAVMSELSYDTRYDYSDIIDLAEEENALEYAEKQREAINLALSRGFLVLTGGPGTGKTTTLNAILSLFEQQALSVMLAAPTGRAAKRLSDITGHEAKTIHRLLEVASSDGMNMFFVHNENNPLDCDVLIVDEMSMVDSRLFEALLRAVSISCKLVLVGDSDQLPSVGAGNVLRDIIESSVMPVVTLTDIFRQAQQSSIIVNAHKIVKGIVPDIAERGNDFYFMQRNTSEALRELVVDLCRERLPNTYGYDPLDNIQVLSPTRHGPAGTVELNKLLQAQLNPPAQGKSEVKTQVYTFRTGDKVMQTRNDYDITWTRKTEDGSESGTGIFNGDIGIITAANKFLRTLTVDFDGRTAICSADMLDDLELAYAITVHKSQGSEYDAVILTVFDGYDRAYYRNLLYTAVTRAKKLLVIVGSPSRLRYMVQNDRRTVRYTCLKNMLLEQTNSELSTNNDTEEQ